GVTTSDPSPLTSEELKVDKIVLSWIFSTLSDALQKRVVVARPKSAKEAWKFISDIVKNNKRSCTSALKTELRSITLGDLTMEAYFQKIESLMTILASIDSPVNDEDVVHFALAGLPDKYNQVCGYMHYQDTFPDLKTPHTLLVTEEIRLKSKAVALPVHSSHLVPAQHNTTLAHPSIGYQTYALAHQLTHAHTVAPPTIVLAQHNPSGSTAIPVGVMGPTAAPEQATTLPNAFSVGTLHDPAIGAWNMDTGASSQLNSSVTNLNDIFNTCLYPSISVGDGNSIPITNTGHNILPTPTKSLHLNNVIITPHIVKILIYVRQFVSDNNCTVEFDAFGFSVKDFMTRWVLLRCDSIGDLYPVTSSSPIPQALLFS
ncbi:ribonuclease H-like domain-containing protein, partial [Tanacetum coccineum]